MRPKMFIHENYCWFIFKKSKLHVQKLDIVICAHFYIYDVQFVIFCSIIKFGNDSILEIKEKTLVLHFLYNDFLNRFNKMTKKTRKD